MTFGKIKRGNREIIITSKEGDVRRYLVPLSRQIIVQENDYVKPAVRFRTVPSPRAIFSISWV